MRVKLTAWASARYSPPPSLWVLRKWARNGEIYPAPERVGKEWYVEESARRLTGAQPEETPQPIEQPQAIAGPHVEWLGTIYQPPYVWVDRCWRDMVFGYEEACQRARDFYTPTAAGSGVYIVLSKDKERPIYVGSSVNLSARLRSGGHAPEDAPTFAFEAPEFFIRDIEATYWKALNPPANAKKPPGNVIQQMIEPIRQGWAGRC